MSQIHSISRFFNFILFSVSLTLFSQMALAEPIIDLNKADAETLQYIPGIGPSKSKKIVAFRQQIGGFKSMDDLLSIPGVGEKLLAEIQRHGAIDKGVSALTEEMKSNPPKKSVTAATEEEGGSSG